MARAATTSDAFNAIAEPQRREILVLLRGGQAAAVRLGRPRAAAGPRVGGRLRAVLERELRPAGRVRAGPETGKAGGTTRWRRAVAAASPNTRPRTARS